MPRPQKHRHVRCNPGAYYFKPRAIPLSSLEEIILKIDELESLRLADYLALSHEQAAAKMKISRATFGRIVETARKKIVDAILNGKAIKISNEIPDSIKEKANIEIRNCKSLIKADVKCQKCKKNKPGEVY
jgi:predicted DNA-binding protein (UPF0251 family)